MWWVGPLPEGFMSSVFPALAKILLQEDDPEVLEVTRLLGTFQPRMPLSFWFVR